MIPFETHRVWIVEAPLKVDTHGNRSRSARDWGNDTVVAANQPASVQPDAGTMGAALATDEVTRGGRERTVETKMFRLNPNSPVTASMGIRVGSRNGELYLVVGEPQEMPDPLGGGLAHIAVKARRERG